MNPLELLPPALRRDAMQRMSWVRVKHMLKHNTKEQQVERVKALLMGIEKEKK